MKPIALLLLSIITGIAYGQSVSISGVSPYNTINLTANYGNLGFGNITESYPAEVCTGSVTYRVFVSSANGGMVNPAAGLPSIRTYSVRYRGSSSTTVTTGQQELVTFTRTCGTAASNLVTEIKMHRSGVPTAQLYYGTFTDTLSIYMTRNDVAVPGSPATLVLTSLNVGSAINLTVTPTTSAANLPLTANQTNMLVGTASEWSNSPTGYRVKIKSANGGMLNHTGASGSPAATEKINYTLRYNAANATLSPANTDFVVKTVGQGIYQAITNSVDISYIGISNTSMKAGTYSDTLTFTVEAQ